jgi:hypothetical protein
LRTAISPAGIFLRGEGTRAILKIPDIINAEFGTIFTRTDVSHFACKHNCPLRPYARRKRWRVARDTQAVAA